MQYATMNEAAKVTEDGKEHNYFWSFRESGRREWLLPEECRALGLPADEWFLSQVRWIKGEPAQQCRWWVVLRRQDDLAYGITDGSVSHIIQAIMDRAEDRLIDASLFEMSLRW